MPPVTRERRDRLLAWMREHTDTNTAPTARELLHLAPGYVAADYGVVLKDLGELERYGMARCAGHPRHWRAVTQPPRPPAR